MGADETVFSVKGEEVVVGFVVDASSGKTLGFEVLFEGDGEAFRRWLEPYVKRLGVEILISLGTTIPTGWRLPSWACLIS